MTKTMIAPPPPPQWVIDLNSPPATKPSRAIADPPGFVASATGKDKKSVSKTTPGRAPPTPEEMDVLRTKKAWEVALAPVKQLPMTGFMMYMSGSGLQIFSIMMVFMAFKNPIMGLLATGAAFEKFESRENRMWEIKAVYVAMQVLALALGVWKVNQMGLLPTTRSDWLAWESAREPIETAIPAF